VTPGGWTNVVQVAGGVNGTGQFSDLSPAVVASGAGIATTNYVDVGGAGHGARYYRVRTGP
jgi:hypothetical protein